MDSEDEGFYSSSGDATAEDSFTDYAAVHLQKPYKILTDEDIRQLLDDDISTVSDVLSVSRGAACTLLCQNNWNLSSVYDKFFAADDDRNPPTTASSPSQRELGQNLCKICYDEISPQNTVSAACGHPFCADCWKTYVAAAIADGAGCLTLPCPEPGCGAAAGVDLIESLASTDDREKYHRYLRGSYVESSRRRKWCPAPGCNFAIDFDGDGGYDVTCGCSHKFCWNCSEEHHRPVGCEMVANWSEKNNSEAQNTQWILAYTKPCPKCSRPIEKNQGCNWMTCRPPCRFHFCWLCGQPAGSSQHPVSHTSCNKYAGRDGNRANREKVRKYLQRYTHYYERWHANEKSRKVAVADLKRWREDDASKLGETQGVALTQLQFVTKAWEQIVECRRVLKWSYAYGYYMEGEAPEKVELFEYSQGEAEAQLERLHHWVEKEMREYLGRRREDFKEFRVRVVDLTVVTGNYFENLVRALENDLPEVVGRGGRNGSEKKKKDDDERKGVEKKRKKKKDDDVRNAPRKRATSRYSGN